MTKNEIRDFDGFRKQIKYKSKANEILDGIWVETMNQFKDFQENL